MISFQDPLVAWILALLILGGLAWLCLKLYDWYFKPKAPRAFTAEEKAEIRKELSE